MHNNWVICSLSFKAFAARIITLNCQFHFPLISVAENCRQILVACWTTRYVKGFLSFKLLAFTPVDVTTSKLMFGNYFWDCVYKLCDFILGEEIQLCCGLFLPWKFILIYENFKLVTKQNKTRSLSGQSLDGRCWRCRPGEWGVEVYRGQFWDKVCGV
jgi:hypothetical protein